MTLTVQTPSTDDQGGQWLSITLAAGDLSVSERTVSRWVSRGKLRGRSHEDGHVEVWVAAVEADIEDDNSPDTRLDRGGHARSLPFVERVDAVVTRRQHPLAERSGALVERVAVIARENSQVTERTTALTPELDPSRTASVRAVRCWRLVAALLAALLGGVLVIGVTALAQGV